MSARQAAELDHSFERNGFCADWIKRLSEGDTLGQVLEVLKGRAEIKPMEYVVDLDADPYLPVGLKVEKHQKMGKFTYDPTKVKLYLSERQKNDKVIDGNDLRQELESLTVANANLLEFYIKNPYLIPKDWERKTMYFWGTIYSCSGRLCVRYLSQDSYFRWDSNYYWIGGAFRGNDPAVFVS